MSILAVKYQNPSREKKTRKPNTLLQRKRNSLGVFFDPETNNTVHKLELFTHWKLGKDRATAEISEKPIFQFLWFVPIFHFPGPRSPFTVARSPFQLVTTKWRNKGGGGAACANKNDAETYQGSNKI